MTREEEFKALVECLENTDKDDYEKGREICSYLGLYYNTYGSSEKLTDALYDALSNSARKKLESCMNLGLLFLAKESRYAGKYFSIDRRKEAILSFASKNVDLIKKAFFDLTKIEISFSDEEVGLTSDIDRRDFKSNEYLLGFLSKFVNEHPTIKQAMLGGFAKAILSKKYNHLENPLDYDELIFPFI